MEDLDKRWEQPVEVDIPEPGLPTVEETMLGHARKRRRLEARATLEFEKDNRAYLESMVHLGQSILAELEAAPSHEHEENQNTTENALGDEPDAQNGKTNRRGTRRVDE